MNYLGQRPGCWSVIWPFLAVIFLLWLAGTLSAHVYGDPRCFWARCAIVVNP